MLVEDPLKQISSQTLSHWDRDDTRPAVRQAFSRLLECRTPALGATVYASENQRKIVYDTCKSPACPSCGHRATAGGGAALPDGPYKGITFTMPDVLWEVFRNNRVLASALSALAASAIQTWVNARHGLRVGVLAILHTFNGRLEFNSHVHTMVSGGGLYSSGSWKSHVYYDQDQLMKLWRNAVIKLVRSVLRAGLLRTGMNFVQMEAMLSEQGNRWWSIRIQSLDSKSRFLLYAGRYVRRPLIAQRRITSIETGSVTFWTKDKKLGRRVEVQCTLEEFINRWAQHIPERYQHAVRAFGLFASRALGQTSAAIFAVLRQKRKLRPKPVPWAVSMKRDFGKDPLMDGLGNRMRRLGRLAPQACP
ncbi:MAG: transposase [Acidobacteriaceae bacterium]|nr:transposase [Acidobacteriaceae bacterium]